MRARHVGVADRLGRRFDDGALLATAMAHRSWCAETPGSISNERLEFLGDAVLGIVITDHLFRTHPDLPEGKPGEGDAPCVGRLPARRLRDAPDEELLSPP